VFEGYLDQFDNRLTPSLCPYCGKKPARWDLPNSDTDPQCESCHDEILLGTELPKKSFLEVWKSTEGDLEDPIFGTYQIRFRDKPNFQARDPKLRHIWKIDPWRNQPSDKAFAERYLGNYIPILQKEEWEEFRSDNLQLSREELEELIGSQGAPATFHYLSYISQKSLAEDNAQGTKALAILQADIDHLGSLFQSGIPAATFSKYISLARIFHYYFSVRISYLLKETPEFQHIYSLFAGGDDLVLIGPYNRILAFTKKLYEDFQEFSGYNPDVHLSCGVSFHKPFEPVPSMMERSDQQLASAKEIRNAISIFSERVTWEEFAKLEKLEQKFVTWKQEQTSGSSEPLLPTAMLYRFLNFSEKAKASERLSQQIQKREISSSSHLRAFLWRSQLRYSLARNFDKKKRQDGTPALESIGDVSEWIETWKGKLKIPIWLAMYATRKRS